MSFAPKVRLFIDAAIEAWRNALWTAGRPCERFIKAI
jgi:hypothetical protein